MAAAKGNIRQMRGYYGAKHRFARRMCGKYSGAVAANARAVTPSVFAGSRKQLNKKERAFLRKRGRRSLMCLCAQRHTAGGAGLIPTETATAPPAVLGLGGIRNLPGMCTP